MESVSLIKTVCRTDAAAGPPWMACFACLDPAYRFHVRIACLPKMHLPLTFQLYSLHVNGTLTVKPGLFHAHTIDCIGDIDHTAMNW